MAETIGIKLSASFMAETIGELHDRDYRHGTIGELHGRDYRHGTIGIELSAWNYRHPRHTIGQTKSQGKNCLQGPCASSSKAINTPPLLTHKGSFLKLKKPLLHSRSTIFSSLDTRDEISPPPRLMLSVGARARGNPFASL